MKSESTQYAVLRDLRNWGDVTMTELQPEPDGALTLARIPGTVDGRQISYPDPRYDAESSGLAIGDCRNSYISDTSSDRVIWNDEVCKTRFVLPGNGSGGTAPGQITRPRGLLIANDCLYVADSGNGRVQVFRLQTLELRAIWEGLLQEPTGLAADSQTRIYLLDRGFKRVLRFSAQGAIDASYNAAMSTQNVLASPFSLAIDAKDILYVTDDQSNSVLRFDAAGAPLGALPKNGAPLHPRALAAHAGRLYIADADSGQIWVFDCEAKVYLGTIADYRGPVAAMMVDTDGALHIKPALDETIHQLPADSAFVPTGSLTTERLDSGRHSGWARVRVQADVPAGTEVKLQTFVSDDPDASPTVRNWEDSRALDTLIPPLPGTGNGQSLSKRFLWLRLILKSENRHVSPRLLQVQAETASESYLGHLPSVYSREDGPKRFLERWLALFRSQLGDWELELAEMSRRFDPVTTPEDQLQWLATWLAFELPAGADAAEWRRLLLRAYELHSRRGTLSGIREFVKLYTGVRPNIFEAFSERRVWQLGETSALGFDTALAPGSPDGMIVSGLTLADRQYLGLRGDYYSGIAFEQHRKTRTDSTINFEWASGLPDPSLPSDKFSVRWTGQIQPRYSESYTFYTYTDDGVRLWVDGLLIIDKWVDQPPTEHSSRGIALTADRWYPIMMEYYENTGYAVAKLSWSSRSQPKQFVPKSSLYSDRDENAEEEVRPTDHGSEIVLVGETVVGESGPLAASDFGMPLFSETAHLFTVSVPAAQLPEPIQRRALRRVVEAEKPAHTDFHLCFIEARMRVGFQARIGIDSIIAGPPPPMELNGATLGYDSYLAAEEDEGQAGRVGKRARIGRDTVIA